MALEIWLWRYGFGDMALEIWLWRYGFGDMALEIWLWRYGFGVKFKLLHLTWKQAVHAIFVCDWFQH